MASNVDPSISTLRDDPARQRPRWPATLSVIIHWLAAAALFGALAGGLFVHRLSSCCDVGHWTVYNLHASFGLALLALVALRILVRLLRPWPALPGHTPPWQRLIARATHTALYVLMIALPLVGWSIVSAPGCCHINPYVFDWFTLPSLDPAPIPDRTVAFAIHSALAWIAMGVIALHASAALFHHFFYKDDILARIVPSLRSSLYSRDKG
ncbi:cytochrome b [Methylobacterium aquaticum]|jgi:cytochrome b561|uniref:cytochrome b n=1 Tax=Methylobacterium aquaticum TaxID=270351 RepID=UPI001932F05C|nr:cytochrome b [Methylobacterium aquaticum]QRE78193.1 cytochrome b [Methylobacterium aquaticum]